MEDEKAWRIWGNYGISALIFAIEHCLSGQKAKSEYIKKPVLSDLNFLNKYKEANEEIAVLEMKQRIKLLEKQGLPQSPL